MKKILFALIIFPVSINAQIQWFEEDASWQQILSMANKEGKMVFVDCFATWCLPCKKMDQDVFAKKIVADYMNAHFISVRLQMDTSKNDGDLVKSRYETAGGIQRLHKVNRYPTYLFFSANGEIVHRYSSSMDDSSFLKVANDALRPDRQYYTLLTAYQQGREDIGRTAYLANLAHRVGEDSVATAVATKYLRQYLDSLTEEEICQKRHLEFISIFSSIVRSRDKVFEVLYTKGGKVDQLINRKGFSQYLVLLIVTKEEIDPVLWPNRKATGTDPDWRALLARIAEKYNKELASQAILNAQLKWYTQRKDWPQMIRYTVEKMDRYGLDTAGIGWALINNTAYNLFLRHCSDKDTLGKMIQWMEIIDKDHPDDYQNMDTYANLLYKVGRTEEALHWEEKASVLEAKAAQAEGRAPSPNYKRVLEKMRAGTPTWMD